MGGWKHYEDAGTPVHGWIWHFFDILISLKISLAYIFIYSLNYRLRHAHCSVIKATLNLTQLETSHTLTFQNTSGGATTVQTVIYEVGDQSADITSIKGQSSDATINLTLKLGEVTLKLAGGAGNTLTATGSITTTKTVSNPSSGLKNIHELKFTSNSLTQTGLPSGTVTIGPNEDKYKTLTLVASDDGKPTNLTLKLAPGKTSDGGGENTSLTLNNDNNTLTLEGVIEGTLTYDSGNGTLTGTIIASVKYNLNDFHDTYKIKY
ncbi:LOW QUALITY PROTEIN: uncharacterized protein TA21395 [Theileria annulata]|uniref:Uncharacterized protein n=1 Tax=Theileria annulata TaxID=5874 RepID=Q4UGM8_THEAN|nr:LOW QUALITY PROTEIN: uncharacterized protein TA21395 [Theileria annulata]CAI73761.1 hypothetical protein TA21395 [Theileria annulata]|eukprot:XP_954438.1 LOW QUALITY PROTEIN: hypothetical protein TA21395 [Theileria annulata]